MCHAILIRKFHSNEYCATQLNETYIFGHGIDPWQRENIKYKQISRFRNSSFLFRYDYTNRTFSVSTLSIQYEK